MLDFHEGKCCDAVIRRVEERERSLRSGMRWPEQEQHKAPVEVTFKLGEQLFAVEHTGIEPFGGHVEMENRAKAWYTPIGEGVKDAVGIGALYELHIPINAFHGTKKREIQTIQQALIDWVKKTAPVMPKRADNVGTRVGPVDVSQVPFKVSLFRFEPSPIPVNFQIRHEVTDVGKQRIRKVKKAIDKKFPKLAHWKTKENAKSILVLEANDVQLTTPDLVADAYVPLAKAISDRPDETYLVGTFMTPRWYVWPILVGDKTYDDFVRDDPSDHWEFDPATLNALTTQSGSTAQTTNVASDA